MCDAILTVIAAVGLILLAEIVTAALIQSTSYPPHEDEKKDEENT